LTPPKAIFQNEQAMKQQYHSIIKLEDNGTYVGWVEEMPGALTHARSLQECRRKLRDALQLMIDTHRHEARLALGPTCLQEAIEINLSDTNLLGGCDAPIDQMAHHAY